jgi:hypothetical protein
LFTTKFHQFWIPITTFLDQSVKSWFVISKVMEHKNFVIFETSLNISNKKPQTTDARCSECCWNYPIYWNSSSIRVLSEFIIFFNPLFPSKLDFENDNTQVFTFSFRRCSFGVQWLQGGAIKMSKSMSWSYWKREHCIEHTSRDYYLAHRIQK